MAGGRSKAVWAVVLGVLAVLTMPVAIGLTRYSGSLRPRPRRLRDPARVRLRLGRDPPRPPRTALGDATLGRSGGRRAASVGRLLGIIGICMASSALIAVAVYGVLVYSGG